MPNEQPTSASAWKSRIEACKAQRRDLIQAWATNVDYRRGKPFQTEADESRVNVNVDWSLTKTKHAQLYSQTPNAIVTPPNGDAQRRLNFEATRANVGAAVDECVIDAINASGIGAAIVNYEAKTEDVTVPAVDPMIASLMQSSGVEVPTKPAKRVTDAHYIIERFSPSDLLWDITFTRSDFDQSPWLGRSGEMLWSLAQPAFNLSDDDKAKVCGEKEAIDNLRQTHDPLERTAGDPVVKYDELFYWSHIFNADEKYFKAIRRLVFVQGKDEPVIDEPWKGQQFDQAKGQYRGACKLPIRVLTLSYISDDAIPPSDTAIGRPQVLEIIEHRTQIVQQRQNSKPVRYFDPNRVDPSVQANLMRGTWQGMIPIAGNGANAIGEVARAAYPRDDHDADRIAKSDLNEQWGSGPNQSGNFASGERSASEAAFVQQNFQTRIGYERARVAKFFCGIMEVLAGLMHLYAENFPPVESITIRPDSTVLLDAKTRLDQLSYFLNLTAKSGFVDLQPVLSEMAALAGVDPSVIRPPQPPAPETPNVSLRVSGEDLNNPIVVAMLMKSGQMPSPEELEAAKKAIVAASMPPNVLPAGEPPAPPAPDPSNMGPLERITKRVDEPGG